MDMSALCKGGDVSTSFRGNHGFPGWLTRGCETGGFVEERVALVFRYKGKSGAGGVGLGCRVYGGIGRGNG